MQSTKVSQHVRQKQIVSLHHQRMGRYMRFLDLSGDSRFLKIVGRSGSCCQVRPLHLRTESKHQNLVNSKTFSYRSIVSIQQLTPRPSTNAKPNPQHGNSTHNNSPQVTNKAQSKDSSHHYIHFHSARLADLFEVHLPIYSCPLFTPFPFFSLPQTKKTLSIRSPLSNKNKPL